MEYISSSFHYLARHYFLLYIFQSSHGTRPTINCNQARFRYTICRLIDPLVKETWITELEEEMYYEF